VVGLVGCFSANTQDGSAAATTTAAASVNATRAVRFTSRLQVPGGAAAFRRPEVRRAFVAQLLAKLDRAPTEARLLELPANMTVTSSNAVRRRENAAAAAAAAAAAEEDDDEEGEGDGAAASSISSFLADFEGDLDGSSFAQTEEERAAAAVEASLGSVVIVSVNGEAIAPAARVAGGGSAGGDGSSRRLTVAAVEIVTEVLLAGEDDSDADVPDDTTVAAFFGMQLDAGRAAGGGGGGGSVDIELGEGVGGVTAELAAVAPAVVAATPAPGDADDEGHSLFGVKATLSNAAIFLIALAAIGALLLGSVLHGRRARIMSRRFGAPGHDQLDGLDDLADKSAIERGASGAAVQKSKRDLAIDREFEAVGKEGIDGTTKSSSLESWRTQSGKFGQFNPLVRGKTESYAKTPVPSPTGGVSLSNELTVSKTPSESFL
jgi:hypothetical protein